MAKSRIEDDARQGRKAAVRTALAEMTPDALKELRASFEKEMQTQDSATGHTFWEMGWRMPFAETLFEMFLISQVESQLFPESLEDQIEQAITDAGIHLQLQRIEIQERELIATLNRLTSANAAGLSVAINS